VLGRLDLEASLFARYRVNYGIRNRPEKFPGFGETHARGPFLETPDNFPGPKTILGAQYSRTAIQFLLILKAKF